VAVTYQRSAQLLGVASSLAVLALAAVCALALNDLAHRDVTVGLGLLLVVIALRWTLTSALDEWGATTGERLRAWWRAALVAHLATPQHAARGDLALAIDQASFAPSLERLRASAAAALVGVVVIFLAGGWLPFVITVALVGLAAPLYQRAGRRSQERATHYQERRSLLEARQLDVLQHAPELRALGAVDFGAAEIAALSDSEHVLALRAIRVALESSLVTEFLSGVSIGLVAMVVGFGLLDGHVSLLRALIAVLVTSELFVQVRRFGVEFHRRDDAERAYSRLSTVSSSAFAATDSDLMRSRGLVTAANSASVDLVVGPSDRIVITGPSGVGKTTLLQTLLGWRVPVAGSAQRTSEPIGYIAANTTLVSGSMRENLTLDEAIGDDVIRALLASLGLVGERFTNLDATLLHDGRGLSTGERVRLLLARALLADARLLVLDDLAGVLDGESRRAVRDAFDSLEDVAIVEATVDTPLLLVTTQLLELRP
jgi:ATP-binding cassette, subfamily C, bacterial CydD